MTSGEEPVVVLSEKSEEAAIEQSNFLSVLANRHRLHILFLLSCREHSCGELMGELGETPVAVSRHLTILRENNIIRSRRCGKIVRYSLTSEPTRRMVKVLAEIYLEPDIEP